METAPSTEAEASTLTMVEGVPDIPSKNNSATLSSATSVATDDAASGSAIGVGDFVEASFASFDKAYGFNAPTTSQVTNKNRTLGDDEKKSQTHYFAVDFHLLYQSILYSFLPFLFFCARRSMFGVASLLRSFLIGHALRLFMTFFPRVSCLESSTSISLPIFIKEKVSSVLLSSTGASSTGGNYSSNHHNSNWLQNWQVVIVGKLGGDPNACPPPSLALLALLTVFAFVVHPDGLTWVLLGKLRELLSNALYSLQNCINMIRDGHIPTLVASGSLAAILAFSGVLYRASFSSPKCTKTPRKDRNTGNHNHSRGKKKRGGRRGGGGGNNERRSGKHSNRIKHGSGNNIKRSMQPLLECNENLDQNDYGVKNSEAIDDSCIPFESSTEISGRKLTDDCHDEGSTASSASPALSTSPTITDVGDCKISAQDEKKLSVSASSDSISATGSLSNTQSPVTKKDSKKIKKTRKQNYNNPLRGHRQKHSSSNASQKQSTLKLQSRSVASPTVESISSSRFSSYGTSMQNQPRKFNQRKYHKAERETVTGPYNNHNHGHTNYKKKKGNISNSYFSSATVPSAQPYYGNNHAASNLESSNMRGGKIYHSNLHSDKSNHPRSLRMTNRMQTDVHSSTNHQNYANRYITKGNRENKGSNQNLYFSPHSNVFNYKYAQIPKNPEKIELAGLLAQVGLIGRSCANLLQDVPDVEALSKLTPKQFEMYNVSKDTQFQIRSIVEARKRRMGFVSNSYGQAPTMQGVSLHTNNVTVRPPPGLGFGETSSVFANHHQPARVESNDIYSNQFHKPHRAGQNFNNTLQGNVTSQSSMQSGVLEDDDNENFEEDLLSQVGGQMAVSILDF